MKIPEQITVPFGEEGQKRDIPQTGDVTDVLASFQYGFPPRTMSSESDAVPPSGQDMNAILYLLNTIAQYAQAGGVYPYSAEFAQAIGGYPVGALVREAAGSRCWRNTVANNTSDPDNGGAGWEADVNAEMVGATASADGKAGIVPAPAAGDQDSVLKGDGTWGSIPSRNIGETVFSLLPLNDAGLHLLDGSFLPKGGIYDAFVTEIEKRFGEPYWFNAGSIVLGTWTSTTQDGVVISDARGNTDYLINIFNGSYTGSTSLAIGSWSTYWIDIDYNRDTYWDSYYILSDSNGSPEYPSAWILYGSNDGGTTWDVLDEQTGQTFALGESRYYNAPETREHYRKYRIVFSDGVETSMGGEFGRFWFHASKAEYGYAQSPFYTEDQWQACVEKYGVCGKFVYTDEGIRLPKITGFIEGTLNANALGDLVEAGLPNIGGSFQGDSLRVNSVAFFNCTGAFSREQVSGAFAQYAEASTGGTTQVNFNASRSNSIYGNSSTVQPQAIKGYLYMVVATSTKTNVQVDIDNIATDLNAKADKDLSNVTKPYVTEQGWLVPGFVRKWSDGVLEQYMYANIATTSTTVTLPVPFSSTDYCLQTTSSTGYCVIESKTTTTFTIRASTANSSDIYVIGK